MQASPGDGAKRGVIMPSIFLASSAAVDKSPYEHYYSAEWPLRTRDGRAASHCN